MNHEINHCVSERKPVGYMIDHAASRAAGEPVYLGHLVWAEGRPADPVTGRVALHAGYAIPGWERRVFVREEAMRIAEDIAKSLAGY